MGKRIFASGLAAALLLTGLAGCQTAPPTASPAPTMAPSAVPTAAPSATPGVSTPPTPKQTPVPSPPDAALRPGDTGPQGLALQQRLVDLGFWLEQPDGSYGTLTMHAVTAFQKAQRLPLGVLYRPKYVHEGVAVHGYPNVPSLPASHGCIRVTNATMDWLWASGTMPIGTDIWIY